MAAPAPNELVAIERVGVPASRRGISHSSDPPPLRGRRKAAVLLVALGPSKAAEVFGHLSEREIEELSLEMAKAGDIPREQIEAVLEEVSENSLALSSIAAGGVDYAREVLERALGPERAAEITGRLSAVIEMRPFEFLARSPPKRWPCSTRTNRPTCRCGSRG